jgi:hypothetical protein
MPYRALEFSAMVAAAALVMQGCSGQESASADLVVSVTAQDTCESSGDSFDCAFAGTKLLPHCPNAKCRVLVKPEPGSKAEVAMAAFTSLTKARFSSVTYKSQAIG